MLPLLMQLQMLLSALVSALQATPLDKRPRVHAVLETIGGALQVGAAIGEGAQVLAERVRTIRSAAEAREGPLVEADVEAVLAQVRAASEAFRAAAARRSGGEAGAP